MVRLGLMTIQLIITTSRSFWWNEIKDLMTKIKMHISKAKLPFYPSCEVKCRLQNGVSPVESPLWETTPLTRFMMLLDQTYMNGWSRVVASQNGGSTSYISPFRLRVLQWSRHLFNYWKNKKTIIERFLILLIWNWIYIDHRKITWLWS